MSAKTSQQRWTAFISAQTVGLLDVWFGSVLGFIRGSLVTLAISALIGFGAYVSRHESDHE